MANLDIKDAEIAAAQLATIGHPYDPIALAATAADLQDWCRGFIAGGRVWKPADQAYALVKEARLKMGNWQRAGGTTALYALFGEMFPQCCESDPNWVPLSYEQTVLKGLIRPPCETCDDKLVVGTMPELRFCMACPAGRHNARWEGERGLHRLNHPPIERPRPTRDFATAPASITPAQMRRALEDEARRRAVQVQVDFRFTGEPVSVATVD